MVDPDDHPLFVSLGCAAQNLLQAALANCLKGDAQFDAGQDGVLTIALESSKAVVTPLFEAISKRQCIRPQFASALGIGNHRPDLVVRFGRRTEMPHSLRCPLTAVLA